MADRIEIRLPAELQEGTESMVQAWLKQPGERVEINEPIVEITTDKVSVEIPAPATGILAEILKQADAPVVPGEILGWVQLEAEAAPKAPAQTEETVDILLPADMREGTESMIAGWSVAVGEFVSANAPLLEVSTDKVSVEIPAPVSGVLIEILKVESDPITPGEVLGRIQVQGGSTERSLEAVASKPETKKATAAPGPRVEGLSPAVRRLSKKHGLDPTQITGTGKGGRLTRQDVLDFVETQASAPDPVGKSIPSTVTPHDPLRKMIATHMTQSLLHTAPHVTTVFEVDLTRVLAHRRAHKEAFASRGTKLTLTAYFIQASARALQAVPRVNSRWHDEGSELFDDCNIGIGTALGDGGLVVPVVAKAQDLSLEETTARLQDLTERAREGTLAPRDVQGGTFTISNHGVSGSLWATPIIIHQPQSAILGCGKLEKRVVVRERDGEDEMVIRPMMYVTLTLDHRMLDAFQANGFLEHLVGTLENWPIDGA
jgi:2-oxoglutarate dehydrogenase E2 component (dihydrolipoamide succinyltransferase)